MKHQCRTYFYIHSEQEIDIEVLSKKLSLELAKKDANAVKIGFCDEYDVNINNMLRKSLKDLFGKEKVLVELKQQYNLEYFLARVPEIYSESDEPNQILSLEPDIIKFLCETETIDDLDYYIY